MVHDALTANIEQGLLILVGIGEDDTNDDIQWLCKKASQLRIFGDENGIMNLNVTQVKGSVILVSQFTLMASCTKGNRPSYIKAARGEQAEPIFENVTQMMKTFLGEENVQTGVFGADMKVELLNDGPVTIILDSKRKE